MLLLPNFRIFGNFQDSQGSQPITERLSRMHIDSPVPDVDSSPLSDPTHVATDPSAVHFSPVIELPFIYMEGWGPMHDPYAPEEVRCGYCYSTWAHLMHFYYEEKSPSLHRVLFEAYRSRQTADQGLIKRLEEANLRTKQAVDETYDMHRQLVGAQIELKEAKKRAYDLERQVRDLKSKAARSRTYQPPLWSEKHAKKEASTRGVGTSDSTPFLRTSTTPSLFSQYHPSNTSYITQRWIEGTDTVIFVGPPPSDQDPIREYSVPESDSQLSSTIRIAHAKGYDSEDCVLMRKLISELQRYKSDARSARENWLLTIWKSPSRPEAT